MEGIGYSGASADAETGSCPAGQAQGLGASRCDPARMDEILIAFRNLVFACVIWGDRSDACLMGYPAREMDRAIELLDPIFSNQEQPQ